MKTVQFCTVFALSAALLLCAGCGGSKPAAPMAKTTEAKPAAPAAPAAPATAAAPAEAAKPADNSDLEGMKVKTITRGQDLGLDTKPAAPAAPAAPSAPAATTAAAPTAPAAPAAPAEGAVKYKIEANDDSDLLWTGYGGLLGHMDGGFGNFNGTATVNPADLTTAQVELTIDMTTIFSSSSGLTTKLRDEHFFNTTKFATAKFVSTGVVKEGDKFNVSGNLDVLGAARNVTFPATIEIKDGKLHTQAEFQINRNDWGIVYQGTGGSFIEDNVLIKFDLLCDPAK